jgi:hypothetical protein
MLFFNVLESTTYFESIWRYCSIPTRASKFPTTYAQEILGLAAVWLPIAR